MISTSITSHPRPFCYSYLVIVLLFPPRYFETLRGWFLVISRHIGAGSSTSV